MLELQADENHEDGMLAFSCHILNHSTGIGICTGR